MRRDDLFDVLTNAAAIACAAVLAALALGVTYVFAMHALGRWM